MRFYSGIVITAPDCVLHNSDQSAEINGRRNSLVRAYRADIVRRTHITRGKVAYETARVTSARKINFTRVGEPAYAIMSAVYAC